MPGAKRRALKNLLSPHSSPSSTPAPSHSTHHLHLPHHSGSSHPSEPDPSFVTPSLSPNEPHDTSTTSFTSDPANYMSDQALDRGLAAQPIIDHNQNGHREPVGVMSPSPISGTEGTSGSGLVHDHLLPTPPSQGSGYLSPLPPPGSSGGSSGYLPSPPPPPAMMSGGPIPQQLTAEQLMFGNGGGAANGNGVANGVGDGGGKKSSKQRFEERQARKKESLLASAPPNDPAWNSKLEHERQEEITVISDACAVMGRDLYEIAPDGHCMFNAIADQLWQIGVVPEHQANHVFTRHTASRYMLAHPDDFMPFLPSPTGEDSEGATEDGLITEKGFHKYCQLVAESGEWGGEPEIQALSRAFSIPIHVVQHGPPVVVSHGSAGDSFGGTLTPAQSAAQGDDVIRISYHKRMYGLGEHYNSLRKAIAL